MRTVATRNGRHQRSVRNTHKPQPNSRLLTYEEAAKRLGTSPRLPRRLVAERRIAFVRIGRLVRISEDALADYIAENTVEAAE